jgi:hypothetical protein
MPPEGSTQGATGDRIAIRSEPMRILVAMCFITLPLAAQNLKILLVEGQGAINMMDRSTRRNLTVRVEEKYGAPGKGIPVTFTLPAEGASGYFKNGQKSVTVTTDEQGYAAVKGMRPNNEAGQYDIAVTAEAPGGVLRAMIPQTNASVEAEDPEPSPRNRIFTIAAAIAAAGSAAIVFLAGK